MARRRFLLASLAGVLATEASQAGKIPHVVSLFPGPPACEITKAGGAFDQALREFGYVPGRDLRWDRHCFQREDGVPAQVVGLVQQGPDVILVTGTRAALAAKNATATIPIVFFHVADPVGAGLVASLSKPSGNITGVSNIQRELTHKRFELLRSAIPGVTRVGGLIDPTLDIAKVLWQDAEMAAQAARITVVRLDVRSADEIETAFQGIGKAGLQAIVQIGGSTFWVERARIARLALQNRLPTMLQSPDQVQAGGLMSYGASEAEFLRIAGRLVGRILRGIKAHERQKASKEASMATNQIDQQKMEQFVHKVLGDTSALTTAVLGALGDKLGLFKDLHAQGPASSAELARRAGVQERYAREWLRAMASAGYLTYDPATHRFTLPPEHAPVLAQETGPVFFGGVWEMLMGMLRPIDKLAQTFKEGGGVAQTEYPDATYHGMDRFTAGWFENLLVQEWLPAVPAVKAALDRGIDVADVGCGRGRAVIKFVQAFPKSRIVGYDVYQPNIDRAMANAEAAGVAARVKFERLDASKAIPGQYDLITTFDVIHDAVDPRGLLRTIRQALRPGGTYLCLDINCSDKPEENTGPLASLFYGFSMVYCMTTSLANGGEGLGTCGLPESKLRELALSAGFGSVQKLPLENPFNNLYEVKP